MSNTITTKTILDGRKKMVIELHISGDGSGQESDTSLVDVSGLSPAATEIAIEKIYWSLNGFTVNLEWDATTDVHAFECTDGEGGIDFTQIGGPLTNNAGSGKTGDLFFSTTSLASGSKGTVRIEARKRF